MKVKAYMRIGVTDRSPFYKVEASNVPIDKPIVVGTKTLPTARFAVEFELPDSAFHLAEQVLAEIKVAESTQFMVGDVHLVEIP